VTAAVAAEIAAHAIIQHDIQIEGRTRFVAMSILEGIWTIVYPT
jgi:hypothetical protein